MNALLLLTVVTLAVPLVMCYDEVYDTIDVDKIIADDGLFTKYIDCMLNKGPCDVEHSAEFKKLLPEVIATSCGKCSPIQKKHVKKTVKALGEKKPAELLEFKKMYDPNGEHEKDFSAFVFSADEV
uniref:Chemosensory protein 2 n=1 Tax=Apocheima cinerarius TaxID=706528 RepID=A0A8T9ELQ6_APOCI|nr:chemosensory protein 2 [Apocheima cinerarius]